MGDGSDERPYEDEQFVVKNLLASRPTTLASVDGLDYLVQWEGYKVPTWEPAQSFVGAGTMLKEFAFKVLFRLHVHHCVCSDAVLIRLGRRPPRISSGSAQRRAPPQLQAQAQRPRTLARSLLLLNPARLGAGRDLDREADTPVAARTRSAEGSRKPDAGRRVDMDTGEDSSDSGAVAAAASAGEAALPRRGSKRRRSSKGSGRGADAGQDSAASPSDSAGGKRLRKGH
jgi:hypothetical protein